MYKTVAKLTEINIKGFVIKNKYYELEKESKFQLFITHASVVNIDDDSAAITNILEDVFNSYCENLNQGIGFNSGVDSGSPQYKLGSQLNQYVCQSGLRVNFIYDVVGHKFLTIENSDEIIHSLSINDTTAFEKAVNELRTVATARSERRLTEVPAGKFDSLYQKDLFTVLTSFKRTKADGTVSNIGPLILRGEMPGIESIDVLPATAVIATLRQNINSEYMSVICSKIVSMIRLGFGLEGGDTSYDKGAIEHSRELVELIRDIDAGLVTTDDIPMDKVVVDNRLTAGVVNGRRPW